MVASLKNKIRKRDTHTHTHTPHPGNTCTLRVTSPINQCAISREKPSRAFFGASTSMLQKNKIDQLIGQKLIDPLWWINWLINKIYMQLYVVAQTNHQLTKVCSVK